MPTSRTLSNVIRRPVRPRPVHNNYRAWLYFFLPAAGFNNGKHREGLLNLAALARGASPGWPEHISLASGAESGQGGLGDSYSSGKTATPRALAVRQAFAGGSLGQGLRGTGSASLIALAFWLGVR